MVAVSERKRGARPVSSKFAPAKGACVQRCLNTPARRCLRTSVQTPSSCLLRQKMTCSYENTSWECNAPHCPPMTILANHISKHGLGQTNQKWHGSATRYRTEVARCRSRTLPSTKKSAHWLATTVLQFESPRVDELPVSGTVVREVSRSQFVLCHTNSWCRA